MSLLDLAQAQVLSNAIELGQLLRANKCPNSTTLYHEIGGIRRKLELACEALAEQLEFASTGHVHVEPR